MVIVIKSIVEGCDTNAQGDIVRTAILEVCAQQDVVVVSFSGILNATSSFVNSALVDLLSKMSFDDFKRRIRITGASRQVIDIIKLRMTSAARALSSSAA